MLLYKLKELECSLEKKSVETKKSEQLNIVTKLKELLFNIDFQAEVIPEFTLEPLLELMAELNGQPLTREEEHTLSQIFKEYSK